MIKTLLSWAVVSGVTYIGLYYAGHITKRWKMLMTSVAVGLVAALALAGFVALF